MLPPDESDENFWQETALKVIHLIEDGDDFSSRLPQMVTEAIEMCDPTIVRTELYLSSMHVADSRLAMARLGLKGVIVIGDAGCVQQAPPDSGIIYHFHPVLPPESDVGERAAEIAASVEFIRRNQPALVCSDLGDGLSAAVCAAFLASSMPVAQSSGDVARDGLHIVEGRRGPLQIEGDDMEALEMYCTSLPIALRTPPSRPRLWGAAPQCFSLWSNPDNPHALGAGGVKRSADEMDGDVETPTAKISKPSHATEGPITPTSKAAGAPLSPLGGNVKARLLGRFPPPISLSGGGEEEEEEAGEAEVGELRALCGLVVPPPPPPPLSSLRVQVFE